jgi:large subunit ribosomal protein L29
VAVKASELRELTNEELAVRLRETTESIHSLRFQMATSTVENVKGVRNARRDVARIKTILRERELAAKNEAR